MRPSAAVTILLAGVLAAAVIAGRAAVVAVVMAVSALLLVDMQGLLRRARVPAILPASALVGLGAPVAAVLRSGVLTAAAVVGAFLVAVLITLAGRHRNPTAALGSTLVVGLLPGLGGSAVIMLWDSSPATLLALLGVLAAGECALTLARRWGGKGRERETAVVLVVVSFAATMASAFLSVEVAAGVGALVLLSILGGAGLRAALLRPERPLPGLVLAATASLALAAPAVLAIVGQVPLE